MDVKEAIAKRLSIRQYAELSIPVDHMETLLRALQLAPSAGNRQNREFVLVGDPKLKQSLVAACSHQRFVGECAYFIAGLADPTSKWHEADVSIALTNFSLLATELGYGTCWIGAFDEAQVRKLVGGPDDRRVVVCMTFGLPKGSHEPRERRDIEAFVYQDRYGSPWKPASQ
jgi:nitroreductase